MKNGAVRSFTVGLGEDGRAVRLNATDRKTRQWANRNAQVIGVVFRTFLEDLKGRTLASAKELGFAAAERIETPLTLAARFEELMRKGFPEERFEIRADVH